MSKHPLVARNPCTSMKEEVAAVQVAFREQKVLWYYYWHRLFGCALAWFFWDVSFYGNKLFQSTFIKILSPGASILLTLEWTLLNSFISLVCPCPC